MPFVDPNYYKGPFGVEGRLVLSHGVGAMREYRIGAFLLGRRLIIPHALSDSTTTFVTLSLDDVLAAME